MYQQRGFSLIELMITIAIMGILVVAGIALTAQWAKQAELDKAIWSLQSAISSARAVALRNEFAKDGGIVTSQLCFDSTNHRITIHEASTGTAANCSNTANYSYPLADSVDIKQSDGETAFSCFAFDNRAQLIVGTASCSTSLHLTVINGGLNENKTFD
ncbi:pilus assembly FimT family protein [Acinetobacter qingfengensis]|uniref:Prepilin-type N-terminal cleavage/methylation domain-containing protein n=1 Tax=Acinetobacter qingfengensis TaxID=1262585 RepID=A0A1E7R183_9GAMM|nr:prepilin-type N-terminal cleavage/methylation domain-containing protein [Acinetobacter qingfengensis]OEY93087.1 hypothetical protein BJI46_04925 [Acinetobacter qingfengensis]